MRRMSRRHAVTPEMAWSGYNEVDEILYFTLIVIPLRLQGSDNEPKQKVVLRSKLVTKRLTIPRYKATNSSLLTSNFAGQILS